jgi:hypothetical protein
VSALQPALRLVPRSQNWFQIRHVPGQIARERASRVCIHHGRDSESSIRLFSFVLTTPCVTAFRFGVAFQRETFNDTVRSVFGGEFNAALVALINSPE